MEIAAANRLLVPGTWHERLEMFNAKRELVLSNTVEVAIEDSPSGAVVRLIQATSDSLDITEQRRLVFAREAESYRLADEVYNPFHPSAAPSVNARLDGRKRRIGDLVYIAYAYDQKTAQGAWKGTAWLEEPSGTPLEISARKQGLPEKEEADEIGEHVLNVRYETSPDGAWYPVRILRYKRGTVNTFPYNALQASQQTSITLGGYWKITFK